MYNIMNIGILGGGQLGRMLLQEAANLPIKTWILENDPQCPAAHLCHHFVLGNIKNYEDVVAFGSNVDVLTIEIEAVNVEALEFLETLGKTIIPKPTVLKTIKNKILQKEFYKKNNIHSPAFEVTHSRQELEKYHALLPAVHKVGEGGYDGKGVQLLHTEADLPKGFDAPSVLEQMIDIQKEIAVIIAVAKDESIAVYPPVEMVFDPVLNLLDYQLCPANVEEQVKWKAEAIAVQVAKAFKSPGLYAVELMVDKANNVWVNETAPRVHNSGHHTIEAHVTSQYEMLLRIMMGMPLGSTQMLIPSALVNLIGAEGFSGKPFYAGMETLMKMEQVYPHIYGKEITKPGRKMGHVTILGKDRVELNLKSKMIKEILRVESKD
jgi:5-(carboxyamino)imidazole ribonucleotide synthase